MEAERILIRGPNWIGDAVLAIPAMKTIRKHFPKSEITLFVRPWVSGLFNSAAFIDNIWSEPKPASIRDWTRIVRRMRQDRFDVAVLLPNSFESALMTVLGRVPRRLGYATDGRRWMLTDAVRPAKELRHQVYYYLDLAKALGAAAPESSIEIRATSEERIEARQLLSSAGIPAGSPLLVLNAGAAYGSAKRWHEGGFAAVANTLAAELALHVVLVGSEAELPIAEQIRAGLTVPAAVLNGRTSLETLIGVLAEASLMITNDSGPMHIAAALGVPTVAIFGSTDERVTGPYGPRVRIVKHAVECSPCLLRECPIDHRCMTRVTVNDVCTVVRELLNTTRNQAG